MELFWQAHGQLCGEVHHQRSQPCPLVRGGPTNQLEQELRQHDHQGPVVREGGGGHLHLGRGQHGASDQSPPKFSSWAGWGWERKENRCYNFAVENLVNFSYLKFNGGIHKWRHANLNIFDPPLSHTYALCLMFFVLLWWTTLSQRNYFTKKYTIGVTF